MKPKLESVALLLGLALLPAPAVSQKPAPQQSMTVIVVNAHLQPSQPLQSLRVSLSYLDGASRITDARELTNSHGQAFLQVSPDTAQRGDIRIEISGANDLVIYQPADGQLSTLPPSVTIQLLPKGSPALLGPSQIEALLHRSLLQVSSLQQQNRVLKQEVAQQANQKHGLDDALIEWAKANGFAPTDVNQHVEQWAKNIQASSDHASQEQQALAELALKHYGNAGTLFVKAEVADDAGFDPAADAFLNDQRDKLRRLLSDARQGAAAFQFNLQFHAATEAMQRAQNRAATEHKKFPDDPGISAILLQTTLDTANALMQEGTFSPADQSLPLLLQAVNNFQSLAAQYLSTGDRQGWARTENNLGFALTREGARASGDQAVDLLDQAVQAHQKALDVYTRSGQPNQWAATQNDLGLAYSTEARLATRIQAMALLDKAVTAHQEAATVYTKAASPFDWAHTQSWLGLALRNQAQRTTGDKALALLDQAVQAEQHALEVDTKADRPRDWAMTQSNLGSALLSESRYASGDKAQALLNQAAAAFLLALQLYTPADLPQQWADTQINLGLVFENEGERTPGEKGIALLDQAIEADQQALHVYTPENLPQSWALAQNNLGAALLQKGLHQSGDESLASFDQAVHALRNALTMYTRDKLPQDWARTQSNLGLALAHEGDLSTGDKAKSLLDQAVQAFQHAQEVFTRAALPEEWAQLQFDFGAVHIAQQNYAAARNDFEAAVEVQHKTPLISLELSEANLYAGHFDDCLHEIALLPDPPHPLPWMLIRDSFKMACQYALADKPSALKTDHALLANASSAKPGADFKATLRYLSTSPTFATGRASWLALFSALQAGDAPAFTAALHQLEPLMQN